ncbi:polysaccharide pyruvyl transferase family protein [Pseudonocardia sp. GCM10023141]|uniref:polysaccharide pyruvyl transferase family protein n=1 Tax=Pseudonocardia sp. GCM10023141 TaxID=3252653 RepID=UPI00360A3C66
MSAIAVNQLDRCSDSPWSGTRVRGQHLAQNWIVMKKDVSVGPRSEDGAGLRIVVQNGEYWMRNNGDLAMLEVTVGRLRQRWPRAVISVLTSAPSLLSAYVPGVEPISDGRFSSVVRPIWTLSAWLGPATVGPLSVGWLHARKSLSERLRGNRLRGAGRSVPDPPVEPGSAPSPGDLTDADLPVHPDVAAAVGAASLVLVIGGGYVCDVDPAQAARTFGVLAAAATHGVPAAMVGQGLGPLADPTLMAHAARVLPGVDLIALREGRKGPALLDELGVAAERVVVTGDDAIELADSVRRAETGEGIGICLRVAEYSPVGARAVTVVGASVRAVAREHGAPLVPLIISEYRAEDRRSTLPLIEGADRAVPPLGPFVSARDVAARVSRCRVVVTGAYHLAVFALAQGIPVVGLTASAYYDDKFLGLRDMFGGGLEVVHLDAPDLDTRLRPAIREAWDSAPDLREPLRAQAQIQIASSRATLDRILSRVESHSLR